jgi:hypothetical protein
MEGEAKCTVEEMVNRINNKITSPQIKKKKKKKAKTHTHLNIVCPKFFNPLKTSEHLSENT